MIKAPPSLRGRIASPTKEVYRTVAARVLKTVRPKPLPGPLVASIIEDEPLGISVAGHLTVDGLRGAGLMPLTHGLRPVFTTTRWLQGRFPSHDGEGGVWFTHCNAPEALVALMKIPPSAWWRKYRIGYWSYELSAAPQSWKRIAQVFHEIWVPSDFVAQSLAGANTRIRVVGHNVHDTFGPASATPCVRSDADFVVVCAADARSSLFRKNIEGAIALFRKAFPEPSARRRLIVKLHHTEFSPHAMATIHAAMGDRPDIQLIDDPIDRAQMAGLMARCDVFLSPHRSEGFGLMIAEAFRAGRVALATNWSGNVDFMGGLDPLLIRARTVPVRDPYGVYPSGADAQWAEPDLDDGAAKLVALEAMSADQRRALSVRACARLDAIASSWSPAHLLASPFARYVTPRPSRVRHAAPRRYARVAEPEGTEVM